MASSPTPTELPFPAEVEIDYDYLTRLAMELSEEDFAKSLDRSAHRAIALVCAIGEAYASHRLSESLPLVQELDHVASELGLTRINECCIAFEDCLRSQNLVAFAAILGRAERALDCGLSHIKVPDR